MAIVRWDPLDISRWEPIDELTSRMSRLLNQARARDVFAPAVDVFETDDALVVKAELPGVDPKDVEVSVDEGRLAIRGERRSEEKVEEDRYYRMEQCYGRFERTITLPRDVKTEEIDASYDDGILRVTVPKMPEARVEPRRIEIKGRPEKLPPAQAA